MSDFTLRERKRCVCGHVEITHALEDIPGSGGPHDAGLSGHTGFCCECTCERWADGAEPLPSLERGWSQIHLGPFRQDKWGCEVDGVWYPPTLDYSAPLQAIRSDGVGFFVTIKLDHKCIENVTDEQMLIVISCAMENALMTLETFRTCACLVGKACDYHNGWGGLEAPKESSGLCE